MGTTVGAGTVVKVGNAVNSDPDALTAPASDTFVTITKVATVTPPAFVKRTIEQQTLNDGMLQAGGGLEAQELQFQFVRDFGNTEHDVIFADGRSTVGQYRNWELVFSDSSAETWSFKGFVSNYETQELAAESFVLVNVTVRVHGSITVTTTP